MPCRKPLCTCSAQCPSVESLLHRIGRCSTDSKGVKQAAPGAPGSALPGALASKITLNTVVQKSLTFGLWSTMVSSSNCSLLVLGGCIFHIYTALSSFPGVVVTQTWTSSVQMVHCRAGTVGLGCCAREGGYPLNLSVGLAARWLHCPSDWVLSWGLFWSWGCVEASIFCKGCEDAVG